MLDFDSIQIMYNIFRYYPISSDIWYYLFCWHVLLQSHILSRILWDIDPCYATSTDIFQYYQIFEDFVKYCHVLSNVVSCYLATKQSFHHFAKQALNPKTSFTKVVQFGVIFENIDVFLTLCLAAFQINAFNPRITVMAGFF